MNLSVLAAKSYRQKRKNRILSIASWIKMNIMYEYAFGQISVTVFDRHHFSITMKWCMVDRKKVVHLRLKQIMIHFVQYFIVCMIFFFMFSCPLYRTFRLRRLTHAMVTMTVSDEHRIPVISSKDTAYHMSIYALSAHTTLIVNRVSMCVQERHEKNEQKKIRIRLIKVGYV